MICFEVSVNGKPITRAGHQAATVLFAVVEAAPSIPAASVEVTGELPPQGDKAVTASWGVHSCKVGDELRLRIIDASEAIEPVIVLQDFGELGSARSTTWPLCCLCGKSYHDVHAMVASQRGHVCDSCIDALVELRRGEA